MYYESINLLIINKLKIQFKDFDIIVYNNLNDVHFSLMEKIFSHLETPERISWIIDKIKANELGFYIFLIKDNYIVATRFINEYKNVFQDVYKEFVECYIKEHSYVIGNTLIVNPNFRKSGIATKIVLTTNTIFYEYYDFIIGSTNNMNALNLYNKLGAIITTYSEEDYIFYYYTLK